MPTITLSNNIGQPTTEQVAQTQKVRFSPVTIDNAGGVTPAKELPTAPVTEQPKTLEAAVEAKEIEKTPEAPKQDTKKMQDEERFQAIARREKAMRTKIRESEAELAKYKAQATELEQLKAQDLERQNRLKEDPVGFLTEQGYTTDQITQALINQPGPESQLIKTLSAKIAKLEKDQQDAFKRQEQEATSNYQNALNTIQKNVEKLTESNPEFEAINASDAHKSVTSYIEKVWKTEGIMLDIEEAAKEIEDYLTDQAVGLAKLNKVQSKLKPAAPKQAAKPQAPAQKPVTLTNKVNQSTRPLTARERAILAFKRELK